jgi:glycosyltransferase involved in cell wall biosynthesis
MTMNAKSPEKEQERPFAGKRTSLFFEAAAQKISSLGLVRLWREGGVQPLLELQELEARVKVLNQALGQCETKLLDLKNAVSLAEARVEARRASMLQAELAAREEQALESALRAASEAAYRATPEGVSTATSRGAVDAKWYLAQYPDVAASGMDPVEHYELFGRHEGRDPSGALTSQFHRNDYIGWVRLYDTRTEEDRSLLRSRIQAFAHRPLISIVLPVYNPRHEWIIAAIDSVRGQLYQDWELCIADDASTDPVVRKILEDFAGRDPRIKVVFRERNGHISAASNSAIDVATGEFIALLDHDDLLPEHALFWIADAINAHPNAQMLYSDEDKVDATGNRSQPYFKPDWNVDLFYSYNVFSHLGVFRASLVHTVGRFREGFEGAQDYDLALRCIEHVLPAQIVHVPRVLYHWRIHPESTAQAASAKPFAADAGARALGDHMERLGRDAQVEVLEGVGGYRIRYELPAAPPLVSIVIPTRNSRLLVRRTIESILEKTTYTNYEILLVDNGSDDPDSLSYFRTLAEDPRIRVLRDERPFNFSALNNMAAAVARGEILALVNNDVEVISQEWLSEMVSVAIQPGVGAVGAGLWYPNDTLQHGGVVLGLGGVAGHSHKNLRKGNPGYFGRAAVRQSFSAVTAACLVIRKDIYFEVGGLDENELAVAFNDVDFCLRVRDAGYRNVWTPFATLYHHESATRGRDDTPERKARFAAEVGIMRDRHGASLQRDPAYNPNLTISYDDFSLAWPPREVLPSVIPFGGIKPHG